MVEWRNIRVKTVIDGWEVVKTVKVPYIPPEEVGKPEEGQILDVPGILPTDEERKREHPYAKFVRSLKIGYTLTRIVLDLDKKFRDIGYVRDERGYIRGSKPLSKEDREKVNLLVGYILGVSGYVYPSDKRIRRRFLELVDRIEKAEDYDTVRRYLVRIPGSGYINTSTVKKKR